jgi:hypothetical protein
MRQTHLEIVQGTPFEFLVTVQHRNEANELVPMPLTNCVVQLQSRPNASSNTVLLDLSSETGGIDVDEELGTFVIQMSSAETSALKWPKSPTTNERFPFQCEITPPDGETIRILKGTIRLDTELVR